MGKCNKTNRMGENLGNWCSYFSHIMGAFLPLDSHFMVYFITWEMYGNWYSYFSHSVGAFFPLDSHFMVYFIIYEIFGFPLQFPIAWENAGKSIALGEPRKLVPIFSLNYGCFYSIRFPFMVYLVTTGEMHGFSHQNPLCELAGCFFTVLQFLLVPKSIDSIKEKTKNSIR